MNLVPAKVKTSFGFNGATVTPGTPLSSILVAVPWSTIKGTLFTISILAERGQWEEGDQTKLS